MTCMLITLAMQLTYTFGNNVACTDNEYLAQLLYVPSCQALTLDAVELTPSPELQRVRTNIELP